MSHLDFYMVHKNPQFFKWGNFGSYKNVFQTFHLVESNYWNLKKYFLVILVWCR